MALLLVLCVLDHSQPLLKSESYKSIDIRLVHRTFLKQELTSIRSYLLQKPPNNADLISPTGPVLLDKKNWANNFVGKLLKDDKLFDEIQELTKVAQDLNKKKEDSQKLEKMPENEDEYDSAHETTAFLSKSE